MNDSLAMAVHHRGLCKANILAFRLRRVTTSIEYSMYLIIIPNGSDHKVIACYLGFYKEGEAEHIKVFDLH